MGLLLFAIMNPLVIITLLEINPPLPFSLSLSQVSFASQGTTWPLILHIENNNSHLFIQTYTIQTIVWLWLYESVFHCSIHNKAPPLLLLHLLLLLLLSSFKNQYKITRKCVFHRIRFISPCNTSNQSDVGFKFTGLQGSITLIPTSTISHQDVVNFLICIYA